MNYTHNSIIELIISIMDIHNSAMDMSIIIEMSIIEHYGNE